jgi:hypothetical protein
VSVCEELERQLSDPTYILATYYSCTSYLYTLYCSCLCSVLVLSSGDSIFCFLFWTDAKCHSREGSLEGVAIDQPSLSRHLRCVSFLYDISASCIFSSYFGCYRLDSHTTDSDRIIRTNLTQQDSERPERTTVDMDPVSSGLDPTLPLEVYNNVTGTGGDSRLYNLNVFYNVSS